MYVYRQHIILHNIKMNVLTDDDTDKDTVHRPNMYVHIYVHTHIHGHMRLQIYIYVHRQHIILHKIKINVLIDDDTDKETFHRPNSVGE